MGHAAKMDSAKIRTHTYTQSMRKVYRQTEIHRQSQKQAVDAKGHKLPSPQNPCRFSGVLVDFVAVCVVCSSELKANSANTLSQAGMFEQHIASKYYLFATCFCSWTSPGPDPGLCL